MNIGRKLTICVNQILQYTEVGEEYEAIQSARDMAERLLDHINETIRDQEGAEILKNISQYLWVGEGYVSLQMYLPMNEFRFQTT